MYLRINQDLKDSSHTYVQFSNLMFDSLFSNDEKVVKMFNLIENHKKQAFLMFMNDHEASTIDYDSMFNFLHTRYFFKCAFELMYLFEYKTQMFSNNLKMFSFQNNVSELKSSMKHSNKIFN